MSMIHRLIIVILIFSFNCIYAQEKSLSNNDIILINPKDPLLAYYSVTKDTTRASISIYINGYQSKKKREKITSEYKLKTNRKRAAYTKLPTFSVNFLSITKPQKLTSLDGFDYITANEFDPYSKIASPIYLIMRQNDGTYLKWKTTVLREE